MNITLKAKHFYYIVSILGGLPLDTYFNLTNQIKEQTAGKGDDDYCTVQSSVDEIERVYGFLTSRPEGEVNMINTEMQEILGAQLMDGIGLGSEEAMQLAQRVQTIREQNWARTDNAILRGKEFLHGVDNAV